MKNRIEIVVAQAILTLAFAWAGDWTIWGWLIGPAAIVGYWSDHRRA